MAMTPPRLTAVTLGVGDVRESAAFYERLGFERKFPETGDEIAFFEAGGFVLAVWDWTKLGDDAAKPVNPVPQAFRGSTLAWNCRTKSDVDANFIHAIKAGGMSLRTPGATDYGGYRGYFADPDGHVWEIVNAPGFELADNGTLLLPK
jgi:predicted lactoylglutathione lyase